MLGIVRLVFGQSAENISRRQHVVPPGGFQISRIIFKNSSPIVKADGVMYVGEPNISLKVLLRFVHQC